MWNFYEKEIGVWGIIVVYVSWIDNLLILFLSFEFMKAS